MTALLDARYQERKQPTGRRVFLCLDDIPLSRLEQFRQRPNVVSHPAFHRRGNAQSFVDQAKVVKTQTIMHERCYGRHQQVLELDHSLDVPVKKPGAMAGSTALEQCRAQGRWPASYDRFWSMASQREGRQAGTRAMIEGLQLSRTHGAAGVRQAVEEALAMGTSSLSAIRYPLSVDCRATASETAAVEIDALRRYDRPQPSMEAYEQLRPNWRETAPTDPGSRMATWPVTTEVVQ